MVLAADPVAGWASAAMAGRAPAPAATVAPGRGEVAHPTPGRRRRAGSARSHPSELHHAALRGRPVPHRRPRVREAGRLSRPTRLLPGGCAPCWSTTSAAVSPGWGGSSPRRVSPAGPHRAGRRAVRTRRRDRDGPRRRGPRRRRADGLDMVGAWVFMHTSGLFPDGPQRPRARHRAGPARPRPRRDRLRPPRARPPARPRLRRTSRSAPEGRPLASRRRREWSMAYSSGSTSSHPPSSGSVSRSARRSPTSSSRSSPSVSEASPSPSPSCSSEPNRQEEMAASSPVELLGQTPVSVLRPLPSDRRARPSGSVLLGLTGDCRAEWWRPG
jgi:hypothetical protein